MGNNNYETSRWADKEKLIFMLARILPFILLTLFVSMISQGQTIFAPAHIQSPESIWQPIQPQAKNAIPVETEKSVRRATPKQFAICVGIGKYSEAGGFTQLPQSPTDAIELTRVLTQKCGYSQVLLLVDRELTQDELSGLKLTKLNSLKDPAFGNETSQVILFNKAMTKANILALSQAFLRRATNYDDLVMFSHSGHGIATEQSSMRESSWPILILENYERPSSTPRPNTQEKLLVSDLVDMLQQIDCGRKLMVLDSCFAAQFSANAMSLLEAIQTKGKNLAIFCCCDKNESCYASGKLSHYTEALIECLEGDAFEANVATLSYARLHSKIKEKVAAKKRPDKRTQKPTVPVNAGDFFHVAVRDEFDSSPNLNVKVNDWKTTLAEAHTAFQNNEIAKSKQLYESVLGTVAVSNPELLNAVRARYALCLGRLDSQAYPKQFGHVKTSNNKQEKLQAFVHEAIGFDKASKSDWKAAQLAFAKALDWYKSNEQAELITSFLYENLARCDFNQQDYANASKRYYEAALITANGKQYRATRRYVKLAEESAVKANQLKDLRLRFKKIYTILNRDGQVSTDNGARNDVVSAIGSRLFKHGFEEDAMEVCVEMLAYKPSDVDRYCMEQMMTQFAQNQDPIKHALAEKQLIANSQLYGRTYGVEVERWGERNVLAISDIETMLSTAFTTLAAEERYSGRLIKHASLSSLALPETKLSVLGTFSMKTDNTDGETGSYPQLDTIICKIEDSDEIDGWGLMNRTIPTNDYDSNWTSWRGNHEFSAVAGNGMESDSSKNDYWRFLASIGDELAVLNGATGKLIISSQPSTMKHDREMETGRIVVIEGEGGKRIEIFFSENNIPKRMAQFVDGKEMSHKTFMALEFGDLDEPIGKSLIDHLRETIESSVNQYENLPFLESIENDCQPQLWAQGTPVPVPVDSVGPVKVIDSLILEKAGRHMQMNRMLKKIKGIW